MVDIAVLVSGTGTNLKKIIERIDAGQCAARVVGVVSDRKAAALDFAQERSIPTVTVPLTKRDDRTRWNEQLATVVAEYRPEVVVLAGFMRVLGVPFLNRFPGRVINVHPSLLPAFPGKDAPAQAIEAGVRISGCTVHQVDEGVDTGAILAQAALSVRKGETSLELHARIQQLEHDLLPRVIDWVGRNELDLGDPRSGGWHETDHVLNYRPNYRLNHRLNHRG